MSEVKKMFMTKISAQGVKKTDEMVPKIAHVGIFSHFDPLCTYSYYGHVCIL